MQDSYRTAMEQLCFPKDWQERVLRSIEQKLRVQARLRNAMLVTGLAGCLVGVWFAERNGLLPTPVTAPWPTQTEEKASLLCSTTARLDMAADERYLYYADDRTGALRRCHIQTGAVTTLLSTPTTLHRQGDALYACTYQQGQKQVFCIKGGQLQFYMALPAQAIMIGAEADTVVWYIQHAETYTFYAKGVYEEVEQEIGQTQQPFSHATLSNGHLYLGGDNLRVLSLAEKTWRTVCQGKWVQWVCEGAQEDEAIAVLWDISDANAKRRLARVHLRSGEITWLTLQTTSVGAVDARDHVIYYLLEEDGRQTLCAQAVSKATGEVLYPWAQQEATQLLAHGDGWICFLPGGKQRGVYRIDAQGNWHLLLPQALNAL